MAVSNHDARFTVEVKSRVDDLLQSTGGALAKWNKILGVLSEAKIAYTRNVMVSELFTHPRNRSGLGVNPHNCHANLSVICAVGADRGHLSKACAFEMFADGPRRQHQVDFNLNMIAQSEGLLASPTGEERLLTVSCSHFSAACKAVVASCRTPEPPLQDANGGLNLLSIGSAELRDIIEKGFAFTILPWKCEEASPKH